VGSRQERAGPPRGVGQRGQLSLTDIVPTRREASCVVYRGESGRVVRVDHERRSSKAIERLPT
jgi:hypothetical protein